MNSIHELKKGGRVLWLSRGGFLLAYLMYFGLIYGYDVGERGSKGCRICIIYTLSIGLGIAVPGQGKGAGPL